MPKFLDFENDLFNRAKTLVDNVPLADSRLDYAVTEVPDGDTIILNIAPQSSLVVRLGGIDAPESRQDFGVICQKALEKEVLGKSVRLRRQSKPPSFGRVLAEVFVAGKSVNLSLISKGCVWVVDDKKFPPPKEYHLAMSRAKKAKAGLWAAKKPEAPWFFRKNNRTKESSLEDEQD
jgi:endonuclease YncB( thermonuclease family)